VSRPTRRIIEKALDIATEALANAGGCPEGEDNRKCKEGCQECWNRYLVREAVEFYESQTRRQT
jgi:hypothetical protein